jgi:hypothetical protein
VKRDTCAKCGAIGEYRQDVGVFLCGSCAFDEAFAAEESEGARALFKKYGEAAGAELSRRPTEGGAA